MNDNWIRVRTHLHEDLRVQQIAEQTGLPVLHVVGCLVRIWGWFDEVTRYGNAAGVTPVTLDGLCGAPGFASAMEKSGWLSVTADGLAMPKFDEWHAQNAKRRELTRERVRRFRERKAVTPVTRTSNARNASPRAREEELESTPLPPPSRGGDRKRSEQLPSPPTPSPAAAGAGGNGNLRASGPVGHPCCGHRFGDVWAIDGVSYSLTFGAVDGTGNWWSRQGAADRWHLEGVVQMV